jgi:hypothetical protein
VHDFFDILGVPDSAPPMEVRRVCAGRVRRSHPDFQAGLGAAPSPDVSAETALPPQEVAVDFVDMSALLDRVQAAFFRDTR